MQCVLNDKNNITLKCLNLTQFLSKVGTNMEINFKAPREFKSLKV